MEKIIESNKDYSITDDGEIVSYKYGKRKVLKTKDNGKGYITVMLSDKSNGTKRYYVHRLVAEAFVENPNNYCEVNHKDENKQNNSYKNLEWCDRSYNIHYGTAIERMSKKQLNSPKSRKVYCLNNNKEYPSIKQAERELGVFHSRIIDVCKGRKTSYKGFNFRYV